MKKSMKNEAKSTARNMESKARKTASNVKQGADKTAKWSEEKMKKGMDKVNY